MIVVVDRNDEVDCAPLPQLDQAHYDQSVSDQSGKVYQFYTRDRLLLHTLRF